MALRALVREVLGAAWRDGAVHAGSFAYLALVTLFPAAILVTAVAGILGRSEAGAYAIAGFVALLPPAVADVIAPLLDEVVAETSRGALGLSLLVGLWTVSGFLYSLRALILRAHGQEDDQPYWKARLLLTVGALAAASGMLLSLALAVLLALAARLMTAVGLGALVSPLTWAAPALIAFAALWLLFAALAPRAAQGGPHWPGALLVILLWSLGALLFGPVMAATGAMARTYGALAGVMLALLFFYGIGFAIVLGAETNAALARRRREAPDAGRDKGMRA